MKSKRQIAVRIICLALVLAVPAFTVACHPVPPPGQVLKVGVITSSTGVLPPAQSVAALGVVRLDAWEHGCRDAIQYVNKELGGAWGYPIELVCVDNSGDLTRNKTMVRQFMDEGCLMFTTASAEGMQVAMETANGAGFPGLSGAGNPLLYRPPQHIYSQSPDLGDSWVAFTQYYMKNIWKEKRPPRMALHVLNSSAFLAARDAAWAMSEELGIEIVATELHAATSTSEVESLTRIKAKNPDVLYIASQPPTAAVIIQNARNLGMYPGMVMVTSQGAPGKTLVDIAGAQTVDGVYKVSNLVSWGDNVPGMAKMTEYARKLHPDDEGTPGYLTGWAHGLMVAEALKLAVKNAGYHVLAKGGVESWRAMETQGIQKLKNFNVGGLQGKVSYNRGDNRLAKSVKVFQARNGVFTPTSDWVEAPLIKYEDFPWFRARQ